MQVRWSWLSALVVFGVWMGSASLADDVPRYVRLGSGMSGHIHPAACVTKKGTVLVTYCQTEAKDMRLCRSTDGGKTWSEPAAYLPTAKLLIYPGALTTLNDGRVLHVWNTWYPDKNMKSGKNRFPQYSLPRSVNILSNGTPFSSYQGSTLSLSISAAVMACLRS